MALIRFTAESLVHTLRHSDLARHIAIECGSFVYVHRLLDQVLRAHHPAHFPTSAVEHLARAINSDGLSEVGWRKVCKALILAPIKW